MKRFFNTQHNNGFTRTQIFPKGIFNFSKYFLKKTNKTQDINRTRFISGFTLIELLVSSAIFLIIVTIGISSLLLMHRTSKITQYKKEQFDTLNAIMEDMVRNIRVGSTVRCDVNGVYDNSVNIPESCLNTVDDSQASLSIAFEGFDGDKTAIDDQIGYIIKEDSNNNNEWAIFKTLGPGVTDPFSGVRITPSPIVIDPKNSGFTVIHAEDTDLEQPLINIRLAGTVTYQGSSTPFIIQTSTVQRTPKD